MLIFKGNLSLSQRHVQIGSVLQHDEGPRAFNDMGPPNRTEKMRDKRTDYLARELAQIVSNRAVPEWLSLGFDLALARPRKWSFAKAVSARLAVSKPQRLARAVGQQRPRSTAR